MSDDGPRQRLRENVAGITSLVVTAVWMGALFTGQEWWLPALLVGYILVVPLVALLFGDEDDRREWWEDKWGPGGKTKTDEREGADRDEDEASDEGDALETLRRRYATGELTDEQFERKLERLLETETLEDVEDRVRSTERSTERVEER